MFFYLLSVVPVIWFLELNEMERRIGLEEERLRRNKTQVGNATADEFLKVYFLYPTALQIVQVICLPLNTRMAYFQCK